MLTLITLILTLNGALCSGWVMLKKRQLSNKAALDQSTMIKKQSGTLNQASFMPYLQGGQLANQLKEKSNA